jgi:LmbE family N-acetylglucosaminyl deacetylase
LFIKQTNGGESVVVLAIGAHPDDLEIGCYGTLAKFVKGGHTVYTSTAANGDKGHYKILPAELAEIRRKETSDAAGLIGAAYIGLNIGDMEVDSRNKEQQKKTVELIRTVKPDLIITHSPDDYHTDHIETSKLVFYASFAATLPHIVTDSEYHKPVVPIFYMEPGRSIDFIPQEYVDVSGEMDLKLRAIRLHKSQIEWLGEHTGLDVVDRVRIAGEFRGMQCGVKYAEGFGQCRVSLRIRPERLLP